MEGRARGVSPGPHPRAVLFDLFNTLVPGGSKDERDNVSRAMAKTLGVAPEGMATVVRDTFDDRARGNLGDLQETVLSLAQCLGVTPSDAAVASAATLRLEMTRSLHEQTWALSALEDLGAAGVLRGLVTDCTAETPLIWAESSLSPHFEAVSFSCLTGHRKPEPEAYLTAVRALGVSARECLYVGDGGSYELSGAEALGMSAIRFQPSDDMRGDTIDEDQNWSGIVITDLTDLVSRLA
ncbi:HAD-IA family hydrolase [Ornithinimicrobium faecis]|uniref:HAD-IA family hydrolase n=1 Tax=Ornithinimicrobium faecis TaxID=2934158 RepID=A0ABY4YSI1_9MICO|nr:HAD-IA family hydrolase [Ornithinimicrobium sp. HY1793]USQ79719.1 HAD-IA family hydrolase [Ornithinimicrobium sp. HY1793]